MVMFHSYVSLPEAIASYENVHGFPNAMFNSANDIPHLPSLGRAANGRCQALP